MMKTLINIFIIVSVIVLTACDKNVNVEGCIGLGDSTVLTIKYGEKQFPCEKGSGCFGFTKVIEDSRCPDGGMCIWQGSAIIQLETCGGKEGSFNLEIYRPVQQTINGEKYSVELTALTPNPSTTQTHEISDYVASITIKKNKDEIITYNQVY